jgi:hypothetical protein
MNGVNSFIGSKIKLNPGNVFVPIYLKYKSNENLGFNILLFSNVINSLIVLSCKIFILLVIYVESNYWVKFSSK